MTWNFPRDEKLFAHIKKANADNKNSMSNSKAVDRLRSKGIEPCNIDLNKNRHTKLLGNKK